MLLEETNNFAEQVVCKLGNGNALQFWHHKWLGHVTLAACFPALFNVVRFKEVRVSALFSPPSDGRRWNILPASEAANLDAAASNELADLLLLLEDIKPTPNISDSFGWLPDSILGFTVKSYYLFLNSSTGWRVPSNNITAGCNII